MTWPTASASNNKASPDKVAYNASMVIAGAYFGQQTLKQYLVIKHLFHVIAQPP